MVEVHCRNPACGKSYSVAMESLGSRAKCKACGMTFELRADDTIPGASSTQGSRGGPQRGASPKAEAAQAPPRPATGTPARMLGRFEIHEELGSGTFGTVYRAHDPMLHREVALKVPQASALLGKDSAARFLREAQAAAQLTHPHIVPIYDAGFDGKHFFIASKFIAGQTLEAAIRAGTIDIRQALDIVRRLADALGYAHRQGIIHRDVKPANVLIDAQGQPNLTDFGLARLASERQKLTHDGLLLGTPVYMSPEQAGRESTTVVGPASDQYSLGVVLYELLTGARPFEGPLEVVIFNVLKVEPPPPRSIKAEISRDLETICQKAMAKEPGRRYVDCEALAEDIRRWQDDEPIQARRVGVAERLLRWGRRNPLLSSLTAAAAALLLLVALVSAIGYTTTQAALAKADRQRQDADGCKSRFVFTRLDDSRPKR